MKRSDQNNTREDEAHCSPQAKWAAAGKGVRWRKSGGHLDLHFSINLKHSMKLLEEKELFQALRFKS
eukprot:1673653-Rhodomonas_salina.3